MKEDKDFRFGVSISRDAYANKHLMAAAIAEGIKGNNLRKECGLTNKLCFRKYYCNCEQLLEQLLEGHSVCGLFDGFPPNDKKRTYILRDGCFSLSGKTSSFFKGSFFIGVDIDKTAYSTPQDFINELSIQPTMWYTSMSHQQPDKGCRFRMIYVFNSIIEDKYFFRYCSHQLHSIIERETNEEIDDKCGLVCTQYFNGTNWSNEELVVDYGITNFIYNLEDI